MRLTSRKKEILSYFEPDNRKWVKTEIGEPPLDVPGVAYLLRGINEDTKHQLESTRRTLEAMVKDGLLERVSVREVRGGLHCDTTATVIRYGLPGTCTVLRDENGCNGAIDGVFVHIRD
ncbi:hypothetical protein ACQYMA_000520 [Salmonella enterica]|nr:hypothetical protein [Salmonella enterica]